MERPRPSVEPDRGRLGAYLRVVNEERYPSWDAIYLDNVVRVYRLLYAKVGNRADAEDLTAQVFLGALGPLDPAASRGEIRAYLAAVARTVLAGYWRTRLGAEATMIELAAAQAFLDEPPTESDAPLHVRRLLDALPARYRRVLELRFLEGLTLKEVARAMDVSLANAKVLQHRALRMAAREEPGSGP